MQSKEQMKKHWKVRSISREILTDNTRNNKEEERVAPGHYFHPSKSP